MKTRITLLSFVTSLFGIFLALGRELPHILTKWQADELIVAIQLSTSIGNFKDFPLNLGINLLWLVGAIVFIIAKKETRILRFVFSLVFFYRLTLLFGSIISMINSPSLFGIHYIIYLFSHVLWVFLSYKVLVYFKQQKPLRIEQNATDGTTYYVEASLWQRFFNHIFDTVMVFILFYDLFVFLIRLTWVREISTALATVIGERLTLLFFVAIGRFIYYFVFERVFQFSPAKLFSETRVVKNDGATLGFKTAFVRTISRFVPFEAFSFIFVRVGWHDNWSDTAVVKEEKAKIKAPFYFLLLPLLIILMIVTQFLHYTLEDYQKAHKKEAEWEANRNELRDDIERMDLNDMLLLNAQDEYNGNVYLKPEKINGNNITFAVIETKKLSNYDNNHLESFYLKAKDTLQKVELTKDKLIEATKLVNDRVIGLKLNLTSKLYFIEAVEPYFQPSLQTRSYQGYSKGINLMIRNVGWPAELVNVEDMGNSNAQWSIVSKSMKNLNDEGIIAGKSDEPIRAFKIKVTVKDSLNRIQFYKITLDEDLNYKIKKLK